MVVRSLSAIYIMFVLLSAWRRDDDFSIFTHFYEPIVLRYFRFTESYAMPRIRIFSGWKFIKISFSKRYNDT